MVSGDDGSVFVGIEPESMNAHRNAAIDVRVAVPRAQSLDVRVGAGELSVQGVEACTSLRMFAGDAELYLPAAMVGELALDTGMGDATLYLGAGLVEGRRPLLVGSEGEWLDGSGACRVSARLRFGDLRVYVEDGA